MARWNWPRSKSKKEEKPSKRQRNRPARGSAQKVENRGRFVFWFFLCTGQVWIQETGRIIGPRQRLAIQRARSPMATPKMKCADIVTPTNVAVTGMPKTFG